MRGNEFKRISNRDSGDSDMQVARGNSDWFAQWICISMVAKLCMARARVKARFTLLSKQAISRGYVVDMDVFQLGLLKRELSVLSET